MKTRPETRLLEWIVRFATGCALVLMASAGARSQDSSPFATQDPLAKELQRSSVFVGKTLRGQIDADALNQIVQREPADRPLKIAVLHQLPESGNVYGTRERYTKALHDFLGLGRGTLLVVTEKGVSLATDALPAPQLSDIVHRNTPTIQNNPVQGIGNTIADLDNAVGSAPAGSTGGSQAPAGFNVPGQPQPDGGFPFWLIGVPLVGVGVVAGIAAGKRSAARQKALKEARVPVERLRGEVLEGLTWCDTYLDLLPNSNEAAQAREARQKAAEWLQSAASIARLARTTEDYGRAEAVLEQAKQQTDRARSLIDKATGGTGMAVAIDGTEYKATPVSAAGANNTVAAPILSGINPADIPPDERAACFFCSRPARISDLTPVTVAINGQRRKVLACADDVETLQHGAAPAVRTISANGQSVPWYRASSYDPYRDYAVYPMYGPGMGYGYGYSSGVMDGLFWGAMLSDPGPVAYPVYMNNDGYATNDPASAAPPDIAPDVQGVGSSDFFGASGNDFASNDNGSANSDFGSGGSDFSSNNDNSDFSSGSDNSSSDWGSSDSGGWDSGGGGSDFGGGDSGGGGGDF